MDWADMAILNYEEYGLERLNNFWDKVKMPPLNEREKCWNWTGALNIPNHKGYGVFCIGKLMHSGHRRLITAHRFSWMLANGPIPKGMSILHKCDNKLCVNPNHLFLGTHDDNMHDASMKGRMARGSNHYMSKLTENQVRKIRKEYANTAITEENLGKKYGITQTDVGLIIRRKTWAWVK
jgi:hypothetical protein